MIIRRTQTTPLDRPFPDENTVAEMYCNEAYTIDNESVEDWTSSLQMLLTFAAIFSAVLVTLIVESRTLLEQDKTELLVDAIVFLMNDLANGTHRPYTPPKFQPSTGSILVNCFFFGSLCLSIATALAAVLAMQWVTDYGAVTRRAGSTPEERVKRRHFRYQGGQNWNMDTIIGALPIALHLSVLLFFVGLIVWMWDVHHSVFTVVVICCAVAVLFYVFTTILAIFYPSCPYRTPLVSWLYTLLHLLVTLVFPSSWLTSQQLRSDSNIEKAEEEDDKHTSKLRRFAKSLLARFAPESLTSRDNDYIRSPDKSIMTSSLVWLSNKLPISPDISQRILVLIDGFASVVDPQAHLSVVPWKEIFKALGVIYQSFVERPGEQETDFMEFARRTHCLSQPGMREILESVSGNGEVVSVGNSNFPVHLLRVWTKSTSSHTSDTLRKQRYWDEVILQDLISSISSPTSNLLETWYGLLHDEEKTTQRILPAILGRLRSGAEDTVKYGIDTTLYLISTGRLPWESTVEFYAGKANEKHVASNALVRKLRANDWVESLSVHPQKEIILQYLSGLKRSSSVKLLLLRGKLNDDEETEVGQMGLAGHTRWTRIEEMLFHALHTFDRLLDGTGDQKAKQDLTKWMVTMICGDLLDHDVSLNPRYFDDDWQRAELRRLSNPLLRLIACATLGVEWNEEWLPDVLGAKKRLSDDLWRQVSRVCLRVAPYSDGDCASLWRLRLRLWLHFHPDARFDYLYDVIFDFDILKRVEQEIQSSQLGIDKGGDFLLAFFHLNYAYGWDGTYSSFFTLIPDILTRNITSTNRPKVPKECVDYLSSICDKISADPARLICLLIELIRADINHEPRYRQPQNLLRLLQHAALHLSGKELQEFSPSCKRLTRYIRVSYQQFEDTWEEGVNQENKYNDPRPEYTLKDREDLKASYTRVVAILGSLETRDGEAKEVSWPRDLLRPTGTNDQPFENDNEEEAKGDDGNKIKDESQDKGQDEPRLRLQKDMSAVFAALKKSPRRLEPIT